MLTSILHVLQRDACVQPEDAGKSENQNENSCDPTEAVHRAHISRLDCFALDDFLSHSILEDSHIQRQSQSANLIANLERLFVLAAKL